jgi:hypothetical protein
MTMTLTMTLLPPMDLMIEPESLFVLEGSIQGLFILLLSVPPGFLRGGHVTSDNGDPLYGIIYCRRL